MTESETDWAFGSGTATGHKTAAWGPLCISVAPVAHLHMLEDMAEDLYKVAQAVYKASREKSERRCNTTDCCLDAEYHELWREYNVLMAWSDLNRAAYRFLQHGFTATYVADGVTVFDAAELDRAVGD